MPLVMSMKPGDDFFVDDERIVVGAIRGKKSFELTVASTGAQHEISEDESVEMLPDVFVSAGPRPTPSVARVAIEAPHEIIILRGDRYRESAR